MTADRIVEFQRVSMARQQEHLEAALLKLRTAQDVIDQQAKHNRKLFAVLLKRDRQLAVVRAELQQLHDFLADAPSITEPCGAAG